VSALPGHNLSYRSMRTDDLLRVSEIERGIYSHPWTQGNFADSLAAGYDCTVLEVNGCLCGYGILTVAAGEAHLLNVSIDAAWQGRGLGRVLVLHQIDLARSLGARILLLEVRPSNTVARALYQSVGFERIAVRRGYYPAADGREDALLLLLNL
jgi:ribosomal-protein-alanine N-acetyltransferase